MAFFGKDFRIGTVRYNWPMSAHASQAFSIAHCTNSEDLPFFATGKPSLRTLFSSFRFAALSIVGLGLKLVVGLGSVLVLFFLAFFLLSHVG